MSLNYTNVKVNSLHNSCILIENSATRNAGEDETIDLKKLSSYGTIVNNAAIKELIQLQHLEELHLKKCTQPIATDLFQLLMNCRLVKVLKLTSSLNFTKHALRK